MLHAMSQETEPTPPTPSSDTPASATAPSEPTSPDSSAEPRDDGDLASAALEQWPELLWRRLQRATESAKPPFHLPTLCSVTPEGLPAARIVVLRRVEPDAPAVMCHTDRRAPKVEQLTRQPAASWVFYDPPAKIQLRVAGRSTIHTDDALADAQWDASSLSSRRCYLAPASPGDPVDWPSPNLPEGVRDRRPTAEEAAPGRANFAVVRTVVESFDVLFLHHAGHRRARFDFTPGRRVPTRAQWLEV